MLRLCAAFASVGCLLATAVAQPDDAKKELEKLQGTWEIIEVVNSGHVIPPEKLEGGQVVFKGDEMTLKEGSDDKDPRKFRIKLDPSQNPKAIDATALNRAYKGSVSPAIYRLEGDTLKLCSPNSPDTKERPKELKSEEGLKVVLLTLKRLKP
jgi:uncharacterized protein (TIGR03067 family)